MRLFIKLSLGLLPLIVGELGGFGRGGKPGFEVGDDGGGGFLTGIESGAVGLTEGSGGDAQVGLRHHDVALALQFGLGIFRLPRLDGVELLLGVGFLTGSRSNIEFALIFVGRFLRLRIHECRKGACGDDAKCNF